MSKATMPKASLRCSITDASQPVTGPRTCQHWFACSHLIYVMCSLPDDALHVGVRPHGEAGVHQHAAILTRLALQGAAVGHHLHPIQPSCFPPGTCTQSITQTDRETDRQTDGRTDRQAGRQAGRQAARQRERQTDRQDRQTERDTHKDSSGSNAQARSVDT